MQIFPLQEYPPEVKERIEEITRDLERYRKKYEDLIDYFLKDLVLQIKHNGSIVKVFYQGEFRKELNEYLRDLMKKGDIEGYSYRIL